MKRIYCRFDFPIRYDTHKQEGRDPPSTKFKIVGVLGEIQFGRGNLSSTPLKLNVQIGGCDSNDSTKFRVSNSGFKSLETNFLRLLCVSHTNLRNFNFHANGEQSLRYFKTANLYISIHLYAIPHPPNYYRSYSTLLEFPSHKTSHSSLPTLAQ